MTPFPSCAKSHLNIGGMNMSSGTHHRVTLEMPQYTHLCCLQYVRLLFLSQKQGEGFFVVVVMFQRVFCY